MHPGRTRRYVALASAFAMAVVGCENDNEAIDDQPPVDAELPATAPANGLG